MGTSKMKTDYNMMNKLQCGYEDECGEKDCHKCPKKYTITLDITYAEITAVEDCGIVDLPFHQKEKPKVYKLTQNLMWDLQKKLFKAINYDEAKE